jgi:XTP/dITP diphosphohydrolase
MMELWIATGNQGKLNEFKMLFNRLVNEHGLDLHAQKELPVFTPPEENGDSFLANARIKARALKAVKPGTWVMADDSGLVVEGLGGLPGIHSARYAGPKASDMENTAKLLKMIAIRHVANRKARFQCVIVAYDPSGQEHVFEGALEGEIAKAQKGTGGFGYDPVFVPQGHTQTLGELDAALKNQISHRAKAVNAFMAVLEKTMS